MSYQVVVNRTSNHALVAQLGNLQGVGIHQKAAVLKFYQWVEKKRGFSLQHIFFFTKILAENPQLYIMDHIT